MGERFPGTVPSPPLLEAAVEMTLSIVSKCFALLRSDPHGRLCLGLGDAIEVGWVFFNQGGWTEDGWVQHQIEASFLEGFDMV